MYKNQLYFLINLHAKKKINIKTWTQIYSAKMVYVNGFGLQSTKIFKYLKCM